MQDSAGDQPPLAGAKLLFLVIIFSTLFMLAFINSPGTGDVETFLEWLSAVRNLGAVEAYHKLDDYPPISYVLLSLCANLADYLKITDFMALKSLLVLATLGCSLIMARCRGRWEPIIALVTLLVLVINSMFLGYIDAFSLVFVLWSINCFQSGKLQLGAALFTIGCLIKWQPMIIAPFVAFYLWPASLGTRASWPWMACIKYAKRVW